MSGIPGMGQRWQAALKIRMIMIPLPGNTAAGAASGVCYSGKGCCKVSGSRQTVLHIPAHAGGEKMKIHVREKCCMYCSVASGMARGSYFVEKVDFRYGF